MTRPFSDAQTTYMPELHETRPLSVVRAERHCAWCGIPLTAVPEDPRVWNGKLYHQLCPPREP